MSAAARLFGVRRRVLIGIALAGAWAAWYAGLDPRQLWPSEGGWRLAGAFFGAAFTPALTYQGDVPAAAPPLLAVVAYAVVTTLIFAAAAIGVSTVAGLALGVLGSSALWADDPAGGAGPIRRWLWRTIGPAVYGATRVVIALMRSVHELLWAVVLFAGLGVTPIAAVAAIAIPYAGTLAKVFSEMIDEAPRDAAAALRGAGAGPAQVFCFALAPRAMPDLIAYALYRFECALRSSTVLGFFGVLTLGYYLKNAFDYGHYREVWTFLYALFAMVAVMDWWSGAVRRRLVA